MVGGWKIDRKTGAAILLAFGLTLVLTGTILTDTFPWGNEFKNTIFVMISLENLDTDTVRASVEKVFGTGTPIGWGELYAYVKVPEEYSSTRAAEIKNSLSAEGIPEAQISAHVLGATLSKETGWAATVSYIVAGLASGLVIFVIFRRRGAALVLPLLAELGVVETLGLLVLAGIPVETGVMVGLLVVFIHAIVLGITSLFLAGGEEWKTRVPILLRLGAEELVKLIILFIPVLLLTFSLPFLELFFTIGVGTAVNLLNVCFLGSTFLRPREKVPEVKYYVSV